MDPKTRRFEALARPVLADLYRFARRLTRDPIAAEDLLQQSLAKGFARLDSLHEDGAFKTWQSRVLYRTWLDERKRRVPMPADPATMEATEREHRPTPDLVMHAKQVGNHIAHALDALPTDQRDAVWLVDGQGHTFSETATILGINAGTAASRVARARKALRIALADLAAAEGVTS